MNYFAYVRVSTAKQGERGSSLQEQRAAIEAFARKHNLTIVKWYEEVETAASLGRRVFGRMLADLKANTVQGIILHKVDRGARNLKDWASIGDLIDMGVKVHFAHESLDLNSRGGRLAADVQAVVAADYIRNLREEVKKGFYGRLKQGLLPLPAPLGYRNNGGGAAKTIDPLMGPLIRAVFELYDTGTHSLKSLRDEMHARGLRNLSGGRVSRTGLSNILQNPFYIGLIRIRRSNEMFAGAHQPLIAKALFDRVQDRLHGKAYRRVVKHDFLFRRLLRCAGCSLALIGERQKGHAYYRCHAAHCAGTSVREEAVDAAVREALAGLSFTDGDIGDLRDFVAVMRDEEAKEEASRRQGLAAASAACHDRLMRLTDAFVDGSLEREIFMARKDALLRQKVELENALVETGGPRSLAERIAEDLELAQSALLSYETGNMREKRAVLESVTSNLLVTIKKPAIVLRSPFREIRAHRFRSPGPPCNAEPRTAARAVFEILRRAAEAKGKATDGPIAGNVPHVPKSLMPGRSTQPKPTGTRRSPGARATFAPKARARSAGTSSAA